MEVCCRDQLAALRRSIHQEPELSWEERKTQKRVLDYLKDLGVEAEPVCGTGVLATIRGKGSSGHVLGIRADMDALPIEEQTGLAYASRRKGIMHACGHDAHVAILLGTARALWERRDELAVTVRLIFQPAEECIEDSGAGHMKELPGVKECERIIALHVWGSLPFGKAALACGPVMASADTFEVEIRGRGGHGAHPERTIDPIAVGVTYCRELDRMMARERDPLERAVLSVTTFHGGTAPNVIGDSARLSGTARAFSEGMRERFPEMLDRAARGVEALTGARVSVAYHRGCPVTVNDEAAVRTGRRAAARVFGEENLVDIGPQTGGEDFSKYEAPKAFLQLGAGDERLIHQHDPAFVIDERALPLGVEYFVEYVREWGKEVSSVSVTG